MTGRCCSDLLADKFRELCVSGKKEYQCQQHGPPTLISRELPCTVARTSRASVMMITTRSEFSTACFGLRAIAPLSLLSDLNCCVSPLGTSNREPSSSSGQLHVLLLRCLERSRFSVPCEVEVSVGGHWTSGRVSDSPSPCPSLARASRRSDRLSCADVRVRRSEHVEASCDPHDDPSQGSETTTKMKGVCLGVLPPAPRFSGRARQIFPHQGHVCRNDNTGRRRGGGIRVALVECAAMGLGRRVAGALSLLIRRRSELWCTSGSVVARSGVTPNSSPVIVNSWVRPEV